MYSVQIREKVKSNLTLKRCNLYVSLWFSTGADKPETNNSNSAELPKQLPHH